MGREKDKRAGEKTIDRILDEAEDLFAAVGFKAASAQEITTRVGISQPAFYNHFKDKEALYTAVFARALQPVITMLDGFIEQTAKGERPADYAGDMFDLFMEHKNVAALIVRALLSPEGEPGRDMALDWLEKLFNRGNVFDALLNPGGDRVQTVLLHVMSYGLTNGFILMEPMLPRLLGRSVRRGDFMQKYKAHLTRLYDSVRPSDADVPKPKDKAVPAASPRRRIGKTR